MLNISYKVLQSSGGGIICPQVRFCPKLTPGLELTTSFFMYRLSLLHSTIILNQMLNLSVIHVYCVACESYPQKKLLYKFYALILVEKS